MIGLIDCGLGNLSSIRNAISFLGGDVKIITDPGSLGEAQGLILPGVGAFADAMKKLHHANWIGPLNHLVRGQGMPFLGICLGMQVLAERGREGGDVPGLGWVSGTVERIRPTQARTRLPHMGWNDVSFLHGIGGINKGLGELGTFYFMHSFSLRTSDTEVIKGVTDYSGEVTACLEKDHIWATQFHPEKSQKAGLQILRNFIDRAEGSHGD